MQASEDVEPSEDFIRRQGPAFLPALLRRIAEELLRGAEEWSPEAGLSSSPRVRSTLLALDEQGPMGVVEIAKLLQQSHPLVITWIKQLQAEGLAKTRTDTADRRRTVVALTTKGVTEVRRLRKVLPRMAETAQALMDEAAPGLFEALWRMEQACRREPFADRLRGTGKTGTGKKKQ